MHEPITESVAAALRAVGVTDPEVQLDWPGEYAHGDITTNVALVYAKELQESPRSLAERIVANLPEIPGVRIVTVAGPGFINFFYAPEMVTEYIGRAHAAGKAWGEGVLFSNRTIMVEHTQPNPFKPFHIGHLMSNTIGEAMVRLHEFQGARVIRANYQGDVGPHVAKALWGIRALGVDVEDIRAVGKAYAHGAKAYEADPAVKMEIDSINRLVYEQSDKEINDVYAVGRKASLARFEELYTLLGSTFDRYYFESETAPIGVEIVSAHPDVFPLSDGARVFKGEEHGLHTRVFITSQGFPTYEAKELGLEHLKNTEYPEADEFIITTAVEQKGVFEVIKKVLGILEPELGAKLSHISHGMMLLPTGKMSSRTGDVITAESLIESLIERAMVRAQESRSENPEQLGKDIGVGAIKFQILKQAAGKDIIFDEARALSLEGDSGPYMQYTYARCVSILKKGEEAGVAPKSAVPSESSVLERLVVRFPQVLSRAAVERAPHHIANYLIELCGAFNTWYAQEQILDGTEQASRKLAVVSAVRHTVGNGLRVLGIPTPEQM